MDRGKNSGCVTGLVSLGAIAASVFFFVIALVIAALIPLPVGWSRGSVVISVIFVGLLTCVGVTTVVVIYQFATRTKEPDSNVGNLGLTASPHWLLGRQYSGLVSGRPIRVIWHPPGDILDTGSYEFEVKTSFVGEVYVQRGSEFGVKFGETAFAKKMRSMLGSRDDENPIVMSSIGPLVITGGASATMRRVLQDPRAVSALSTIVANTNFANPFALQCSGGDLRIFRDASIVDEQSVRDCVDSMCVLAWLLETSQAGIA